MKKEDFTHWNGITALWNDLKTVCTYFYVVTHYDGAMRVIEHLDKNDKVIESQVWVSFTEVQQNCMLRSDVERDYIKKSDIKKLLGEK